MALGLDVCILVVDGKNNEYNTEGMKKNLSGFFKSYSNKVIFYEIVKDI